MCTVTLIRPAGGADARRWRLACNRDELRTRPAALAPVRQTCGGREALMPIDPPSGGTWIGVNDAGLVATLLNVNLDLADPAAASVGRISRGLIVPALLEATNIEGAARRLAKIDVRRYPPFRAVVTDGRALLIAQSDGAARSDSTQTWDGRPLLWTSSGLGDALVEPPRRALFEAMFSHAGADRLERVQDGFHRHRFEGRPHLSVNMSRDDARTVSLTQIEVDGRAATLRYFAAGPDDDQPPLVQALALSSGARS